MQLESFRKTVIELELVSQRELDALIEALGLQQLPPVPEATDASTLGPRVELLVRELVNSQKLTRFQARRIWSGEGATLLIGNYLLVDKIGRGGMGTVFRATHRIMRRPVAIKTLHATEQGASDELLRRFQREVRTAARLTHPNIVTAYDAGQQDGHLFLVMELVEGRDLATEVARQGTLSGAKAIACILQVAQGLAYAHTQGIVHRDIKPRNLLITESGQVKILDLGLARLADAQRRTDESNSLDGSGSMMISGTADYMSPEQADDPQRIDVRSDIYSLGCTLFYLLRGEPPFPRPGLLDTLIAHQTQPFPRLTSFRTDLPEQLQSILDRMTAKRPEDRYSSMNEVVLALTPLDDDSDFSLREDVEGLGVEELEYETRVFDSHELSANSLFGPGDSVEVSERGVSKPGHGRQASADNAAVSDPFASHGDTTHVAPSKSRPSTVNEAGRNLTKRVGMGQSVDSATDVAIRSIVGVELSGDQWSVAAIGEVASTSATSHGQAGSTDKPSWKLPSAISQLSIPAAIFVTPQRDCLLGQAAREQLAADSRHGWTDPLEGLENPASLRSVYGSQPPAEVLIGLLLQQLMSNAREAIGSLSGVALSVPHHFTDPQRIAIKSAARWAQVESVMLVDEIQAALAALGNLPSQPRDLALRDGQPGLLLQMGARTTSVLLFVKQNDKLIPIDSLVDTSLGNGNWDQTLIQLMADAYRVRFKTDPKLEPLLLQQIAQQCDAAHQQLSRQTEALIDLHGRQGRFSLGITRAHYQRQTAMLVERVIALCTRVLEKASLSWISLQRIALGGAAIRHLALRRSLAQHSGKEPRLIPHHDEAIAMGSAIVASRRLGSSAAQHFALDALASSPWSLGLLVHSPATHQTVYSEMIPAGSCLPCSASKSFRLRKQTNAKLTLTVAQYMPGSSDSSIPIAHLNVVLPKTLNPAHSAQASSAQSNTSQTDSGLSNAALELRLAYGVDATINVQASVGGQTLETTIDRLGIASDQALGIWTRKQQRSELFDSDEIGLLED